MKEVDMSSDAVTRRLKRADQLRTLCLSLMKAKRVHDEKIALGNYKSKLEKNIKPLTAADG